MSPKFNTMVKLLPALFFIFSFYPGSAQLLKSEIEHNINEWLNEHNEGYELILNKEAEAKVTRYHPERENEKNDLIEVAYKGMKITIKFKKPFEEITLQKDSLQKYVDYLSIHNIFNDISAEGWDIYPSTALSALRGKGIEFTAGGKNIGFKITWEFFMVGGYKNSKKCHEELGIEDGSISDHCMVAVRKKLPLWIVAEKVKLEP